MKLDNRCFERVIECLEDAGFAWRGALPRPWEVWENYLELARKSFEAGFKAAGEDLKHAFFGMDGGNDFEFDDDKGNFTSVDAILSKTENHLRKVIAGNDEFLVPVNRLQYMQKLEVTELGPGDFMADEHWIFGSNGYIQPTVLKTYGKLLTETFKRVSHNVDCLGFKIGYNLRIKAMLTLLEEIRISPELRDSFERLVMMDIGGRHSRLESAVQALFNLPEDLTETDWQGGPDGQGIE